MKNTSNHQNSRKKVGNAGIQDKLLKKKKEPPQVGKVGMLECLNFDIFKSVNLQLCQYQPRYNPYTKSVPFICYLHPMKVYNNLHALHFIKPSSSFD